MAIERANDLRAFKGFIDAKLATRGAEITVDDALVQWEAENQSDEERENTLRAIGEGLEDVDAGRSRPLEEFDNEFRSKHGLPPRSIKKNQHQY